jgi:tRNA modification GTPase
MQLEQDTIVAISTPPGRGGIGIVRLSGPNARAIAESMLRLARPLAAGRARRAHLLDLIERGGEAVLDEAVVTFFAGPRSYTAEDVVEIATHGSPVILEAVLRTAIAAGARLAEPGEFTQRAFLSGRLDLTQAEAVNDLIAAQTLAQARIAAAQLGGSLAQTIAPHKHKLIALIAELEAGIDFAEDDLDLLPPEQIALQIHAVQQGFVLLADSFAYGRILREGFTLAIVGRPNAGKSSLFNRLLDRERAIVTAQPGTTRDPISERLSLDGIPVELVDTAGLREVAPGAEFEPERQGITRSRITIAEADMVLHVVDLAEFADAQRIEPLDHPEDRALAESLEGRPHLLVLNKLDLAGGIADAAFTRNKAVAISARTGQGLAELRAAILAPLTRHMPSADSTVITNLRQHQALTATVQALERAAAATAGSLPHEMLLLDLYAALESLDALTGQTSSDDILHLIFSTFCIGK